MATWTIKDKVSNLLPIDEYDVRIESVTPQKPKEDGKNATIRFTLVVIGGEYDGQKVFVSAPIVAEYMGILAGYLAGTEAFDENDELEDDFEVLARQISAKIEGKVYKINHKHRLDKKTGSLWPDVKFMGPAQSNFS